MMPRLTVTIFLLLPLISFGCTDFTFLNVVPSELPAPLLKFEQPFTPDSNNGCITYPLSPADASIYALEDGRYMVEIAIFESKDPFSPLREGITSSSQLNKRVLSPRILTDSEIKALNSLMESIEIIEEIGFTEFCASDKWCGFFFFTVDGNFYPPDVTCPNGAYQYIAADSQNAIRSYLANLAN